MGLVMQRSFGRNTHPFEPTPWVTGSCGHPLGFGAVGLAGPVSNIGNDRTNNGMDPSDPSSWVRPYNPQPGMCAQFNFDPFLGGEPPRMNTATGLTVNMRPGRRAVDGKRKRKRWGEP
jgi:hypothetical protein